LHDAEKSVVESEQRNEELGQVAERALDDTGRAGAEPIGELVDAAAHEACERGDREAGDDERHDGAADIGVSGDAGKDGQQNGCAEDDPIGPREDAQVISSSFSRTA
jgi:hypothetical protein